MRRKINNIISVIYSLVRFSLIKIVHASKFSFYFIERFSPNVVLEISEDGKVFLGKRVRIHSGGKIKVRNGAKLVIGDDVKINYNCIIACHHSISIGEGTEFGPSVYVYDHDHDFRIGLKENKYLQSPVEIGKNCWIGANCVILRGSKIGDNCVIAAGTVVKGEYPANTLIYQKRETMLKDIS